MALGPGSAWFVLPSPEESPGVKTAPLGKQSAQEDVPTRVLLNSFLRL